MSSWMEKIKSSSLIFFFLTACTTGGFKPGVASEDLRTSVVNQTDTEIPIPTTTPSETPIPTLFPFTTPTQGPPPDLEVLNLSMKYDGNGHGQFYGEIRNNTDTPMVFPVEDSQIDIPILRFAVNAWGWNGANGDYWHYEFGVGKGPTENATTNCLLYPGETGIIRFTAPGCMKGPGNCIAENKIIYTPPAATGMQLVGYQDLKTYMPWPGLPTTYHPQAENVKYKVQDHRIDFSFDLPKLVFRDPYYNIMTWIVLYDANNQIIGILYRGYVQEMDIDMSNDPYHITGFTETENHKTQVMKQVNDYFGNLQDEDLLRTDHIRVMVERQHTYLCSYNHYELFRKYIIEHPE